MFDGEFISADCNLLKPDEIYKKFCNYFSINPESCLFIDDTPINVYNSKQIGIDGIIINRNVNDLKRQFKTKGINLQ